MRRLSYLLSDRAVQLGVVALLLGTAGAGYSMRRALALDNIDATPAAQSLASVSLDPPTHVTADVRGAVQVDPFMPTRTAPTTKYLLPWEETEEAAPARPQPPRQLPIPALLYPGKDSASASGWFFPRQGVQQPIFAKVGGKIGEYTLVKVDWPYKAVFVSAAGERIETKLPNPR